MDYISLDQQVDEKLKDFYPRCTTYTPAVKQEMHDLLLEHKADMNDFISALALYRKEVRSDFQPNGPALMPYIVKVQKIDEPRDMNKTMKIFEDYIREFGWHEAVSIMKRNGYYTDWVNRVICNPTIEYSCLPSWLKDYFILFHGGHIIQAQRHYIKHCPNLDKVRAYKLLNIFEKKSDETMKSHYKVFTPKVTSSKYSLSFVKKVS